MSKASIQSHKAQGGRTKNTGNRSQLPVTPWLASRRQWTSARSFLLFPRFLAGQFVGRGGEPFGVRGPIERQVAIIDFEGQNRQRCLEESAGNLTPAVTLRVEGIPASAGAGVIIDLAIDQFFADARVPFFPVLVLEVVQKLGGVIPV